MRVHLHISFLRLFVQQKLTERCKSTIIENIKILQKKKKRLSTPIKGDGWSLMLRRKIKGEGRGREGRREERREAGRQAGMVDLNAEPHTHLNSLFWDWGGRVGIKRLLQSSCFLTHHDCKRPGPHLGWSRHCLWPRYSGLQTSSIASASTW